MSPAATRRPLITEVTRKLTPIDMPTSPFARSRRSSGISAVTRVDRAIPRMLPAITPIIASTMNTHSRMLAGSVKTCFGVSW